MKQVMAPLPKEILQLYKPSFTFSGVDFFGPLMVKWGRGSAKHWGCLFTCLTTRAVFLELVPSLETDDFIMALWQFVSQKGPPTEIRSDRGLTLSGQNMTYKMQSKAGTTLRSAKSCSRKGSSGLFTLLQRRTCPESEKDLCRVQRSN